MIRGMRPSRVSKRPESHDVLVDGVPGLRPGVHVSQLAPGVEGKEANCAGLSKRTSRVLSSSSVTTRLHQRGTPWYYRTRTGEPLQNSLSTVRRALTVN